MLGTRIGTQAAIFDGLMDLLIRRKRPQIISESLAFLPKTSLHKFQETLLVGDIQRSPLAGQSHSYQRGLDARRRTKCARWNAQRNFGLGVELAECREIAIFTAAGARRDAFSDFQLNYDVNRENLAGIIEQMAQDWRRDVVGQVALDPKIAREKFLKINSEDVRGNNLDVLPSAFFRLNFLLQIFS